LNKIISEVRNKNIKEENLRSYLSERITEIIQSQNEENNKSTNYPKDNSERFNVIENKLEACEKENLKLKKIISTLYDRTIVIIYLFF